MQRPAILAIPVSMLLGLALLIMCAASPASAASVPRILVLNSYNHGYDWSEDEMEGLRSGLASAYPRVELYIEHLDTKKFPTKQHFPQLADLLENKYAQRPLDVVIAMDNAALEFAVQYRQRISAGTPLVFCGINDYVPAMIAGQTGITGVAEYHDLSGTLALALKQYPAVRDVVVIHDFTDTGLAISRDAHKAARRYPTITLHTLDEMPLEETLKKLRAITPGYLVLMLSYTVEQGGRTFSHAEAARLVSMASPVPVYSVYAEQLGAGVLGGRMMAGQSQGQKAAELTVKIIKGEAPERLPVLIDPLSPAMFDYRVVKRFGLSLAGLPADSIVINKPLTTFAINKKIILLTVLFTLCSTVGMIVLFLNIRTRRRVEGLLRLKLDQYQESQEELQATEEMLRSQVDEYVLSQDELQATEEMLRSQVEEHLQTHDQLVATEEMLRVQLAAVESSSQKFKAVFENSPIAVILTSLPDGTVVEVNQAFVQTFGFDKETVIGMTTRAMGIWCHEGDRESYLGLLREQKRVVNLEFRACRLDGHELDTIVSAALLELDGCPYVLSMIMDISEQKRLQSQLLQSQKMDVVGQLAGGIAHDFNNMLAGIMAAAELLMRRLTGDEKNLKLVATISDAAARSAELTRDLLTFSRKDNAGSQTVHLNEIISHVVALLERTIDKQIHLATRLTAVDPVVCGDAAQLQNALLNLGVNARDAMPQGGILTIATAEITLDGSSAQAPACSLAAGSYLQLSVADTGIGMTPQVQEHIFEPFFTTKTAGKGTGLGLAAVYGTVRAMGGDITVQSQPGHGALFTICLPLVAGDDVGHPLLSEQAVRGSGGILLVDDEEILRSVGRDLLEDLGYSVYLAENGLQALEVYAAHRADIALVMLDMIMPRMGGKETYQQLHRLDPQIRVLFCSGFHREGTEAELRELGASGFIQKPYSRTELSRAVADALAS